MLENPYQSPIAVNEEAEATIRPQPPLPIVGHDESRPAAYRRGAKIGGLLGLTSGLGTDAWLFWMFWRSYEGDWGRMFAMLREGAILVFAAVALLPTIAGAVAGAIGFGLVSRSAKR